MLTASLILEQEKIEQLFFASSTGDLEKARCILTLDEDLVSFSTNSLLYHSMNTVVFHDYESKSRISPAGYNKIGTFKLNILYIEIDFSKWKSEFVSKD